MGFLKVGEEGRCSTVGEMSNQAMLFGEMRKDLWPYLIQPFIKCINRGDVTNEAGK